MVTEQIIDLSDPRVIHIIYPNGKKVPEHMMNPNIGGSFSLKQAEKPQKIHQNEDNI